MSCLTGDILKVNCSAQGDQTLRITWIREYAELPERRATVGGDGTLTVTQLVPEDAGKYFCTASSVGGAIKITADMNLIVLKSEWYILIFWLVIRQLVDDLREYTQKFSRFFFEPSKSAVPYLSISLVAWAPACPLLSAKYLRRVPKLRAERSRVTIELDRNQKPTPNKSRAYTLG